MSYLVVIETDMPCPQTEPDFLYSVQGITTKSSVHEGLEDITSAAGECYNNDLTDGVFQVCMHHGKHHILCLLDHEREAYAIAGMFDEISNLTSGPNCFRDHCIFKINDGYTTISEIKVYSTGLLADMVLSRHS